MQTTPVLIGHLVIGQFTYSVEVYFSSYCKLVILLVLYYSSC